MDLPTLYKRVKNLNVNELIDRAVLDNEAEILDANTAQLSQGKNAFDQFLEEYATQAYAQFKKAIGSQAPLGIPNLLLEGDFYSGFTLTVNNGEYIIDSTDEKTTDLTNKYGIDIFGLSEESLREIRPLILESLQNLIRNELLR
jgi:hypothetical protein